MRLVDFLKMHDAPAKLVRCARISSGYFYLVLEKPEFAEFRAKFEALLALLRSRKLTIQSLKAKITAAE